MIKGINRQMIEVTDTGNEYFERALLVVRPACSDFADEQLRQEARRLLRTAGGYEGIRRARRRQRIRRILLGAGSGLIGLFTGAVMMAGMK